MCGSANQSDCSSVKPALDSKNPSLAPSVTKMAYKQTTEENNDMMSVSSCSQRSDRDTDSDHYFESDEYSLRIRSARRRKYKTNDLYWTPQETNAEEDSHRLFRPLRCRKLILFLRNDQVVHNECPLTSIRCRFQELNIQVEIQPFK